MAITVPHVLRSLSIRFGEGSLPAGAVDCVARLRGVFDGEDSALTALFDEEAGVEPAALAFPSPLTAAGASPKGSAFTPLDRLRVRLADGPAAAISPTSTLIATVSATTR